MTEASESQHKQTLIKNETQPSPAAHDITLLPCDGRALIFELGSILVIILSIALLGRSMWPSELLDQGIRSFIQSSGPHSRSIEHDVNVIIWLIRLSAIATTLYLFRLLTSLFVFDSIRFYCVSVLDNVVPFAAYLEWFLRFGIVLYLMLGIGNVLPEEQILFLFFFKADFDPAMSNFEDGFFTISQLINTIEFVSGAIALLFIWSVVMMLGAFFHKKTRTREAMINLGRRFAIGPILNALILWGVWEFLQDPDLISTMPIIPLGIAVLCAGQLAHSVLGIAGRWKMSGFSFQAIRPGLLQQSLAVLAKNGRRAFSRKSHCGPGLG